MVVKRATVAARNKSLYHPMKITFLNSFRCLVLLLLVLTGEFSMKADGPNTTFTDTGSLNIARSAHTATRLLNGKVLAAGGFFNGSSLASSELYDPATGIWTATGNLPGPRNSHTATLLPDGRVLVAGGSSSGALVTAALYDPTTGVWTNTGSLATGRYSHTATLLPNGKVLVAGGTVGPLASAELWDPTTGLWTASGNLSTAREAHTATLLPNGKVLVAGGSSGSTRFASAELYTPATGLWTNTVNSLGTARTTHTATLLPNGKVIVTGGTTTSAVHLNSAELYDPGTGLWSGTGAFSQARRFHTATVLLNGLLLIAGGLTTSGNYVSSTELFNQSLGSWSGSGSLAAARYNHTATLLTDGKVLVAGGVTTGGAYLAGSQLYHSTQGVFTMPATEISSTNATLNGNANVSGTASFQWGTNTNYGNTTVAQSIGGGTTNFSQVITGLTVGTTYHFRAVVSNSLGIPYGLDQQFIAGRENINLITGTETWPNVTQNEAVIWGHSNTVVVAYNDSRGRNFSSISLGGASVSTNGGVTFSRLPYYFNQSRECLGTPSVFYSVRAAKWYITFYSTSCGGGGFGQWESADGINWSNSDCVVSGNSLDRLSTWVDNNPASPYYGRQYATYNDFNSGAGAVRSTYSNNDGVTWTAPVTVFPTLRRALKVTGSLGSDGTIFIQTLDEGGGGLNGLRQNYIYRSTNGGSSWTQIQQNASTFYGPGRSVNGFVAGMYTTPSAGYWREQGWGQPGVGPDGVVHYAYSARPSLDTATEPGNIYYIRSTDNGSSWSAPIQLNTDSTRAQWSPSLSVNARGVVFVSWYDERNTTGDFLERYGRASFDNGATWGNDEPISDVIFPKPLQVDPGFSQNNVGYHNYAMFSNDGYGDDAYHAWTDGRNSISNTPQQDVYFTRLNLKATLRIDSITKTNGQVVLRGLGFPNTVHTLQVSTNLVTGSFSSFTNVTPDASGQWQLDAGMPNQTTRFFRLSSP